MLCQPCHRDHVRDGTAANDRHPIAQTEYFLEFIADHQASHAFPSQRANLVVDFVFSADINASGRLVEHQHLGSAQPGTGQQHLLLIASRQRADRHVHIGHLDRKFPD